MKLIIDIDEKLVCEGFERTFTEEEKDTLIRAIGHGISYEERPHGHWIVDEEHSITMTFYKCTNCNYFGGGTHYRYCPHCGADMRVKDELKEAHNDE